VEGAVGSEPFSLARYPGARKGIPWPKLAELDRGSERTLRYRFAAALDALSAPLTATQPRLGCFLEDPI
jgi:hypothetical protein